MPFAYSYIACLTECMPLLTERMPTVCALCRWVPDEYYEHVLPRLVAALVASGAPGIPSMSLKP